MRIRLLGGSTCWRFLGHEFLLGRHGELSFRTNTANYPGRV
jgi:hypothetical protein